MPRTNKYGTVYLVGAGPGDPGLITLRALNLLRQADVIVYDYLANGTFLQDAKPGAERIYVGKQAGSHTLGQGEINQILIEKAKAGKKVVRLKGGDPFVFGRGGEEALALQSAGVPYEVVPGVTAGISGPAYAGIPVTHRGLATAVTFVTGHEAPSKPDSQLNWEAIARMHGTLVFYMGMRNLPDIVSQLIQNGRPQKTPVAVIYRGTLPVQKTITGTLEDITEKAASVQPPGLIVVGDVINLREKLNWFERKPLFGKRIVVTRSRAQASELVAQLEAYGAKVLPFPTIRIEPPESYDELDRALQRIADYDWIIFTSVNGVQAFFQRLQQDGLDARSLAGTKLCAIGPATAASMRRYGLRADLQPDEFVAEAVVKALEQKNIRGNRVLLPRADIARKELRQGLESLGAIVDEVVAYRTVIDNDHSEHVLNQIESGDFDLITFTSSSTVKNFVNKVGKAQLKTILRKAYIACIGPITEKTAAQFGIKTHIRPQNYTIPDLVEAIVSFFTYRSGAA